MCINPDSRTRLEVGVEGGGFFWGGGGYDGMLVCSEVEEQKLKNIVFHF